MEYQLVGEATLQTLRAANETLVELPDAEEPGRRRRRKRRQDAGAAAEPSAAPSLPGQSSSNGAGPPQEAATEAAGAAAHAAESAAGEQHAEHVALHSGNGASPPQREELEQPPPPLPLPVGLPAEDAMTAAEAAQQARGTQPHSCSLCTIGMLCWGGTYLYSMHGMLSCTSSVPAATHLRDASPLAWQWLYVPCRTTACGVIWQDSFIDAVHSTRLPVSMQALELGKDKGTGVRWPLFPTFSDGVAGPAQVQSADASRTLSSSLAGSFTDGDGVRCACESRSLLITHA